MDNTSIDTKANTSDVNSSISSLNSQISTLNTRIYPVGSIYISVNNTNPATIFGGTWEQIKDRFLLASGDTYSAGSTGGESQHTHKYGFRYGAYFGSVIMEGDSQSGALQGGTGEPVGGYTVGNIDVTVNNNAASATRPINAAHYASIADTSSASNMPPYVVVYMWKRTA